MFTGIAVSPEGTAKKLPDAPTLYSIKSVAAIDSASPSNLTAAASGAAGRRGSDIVVGSDAGAPPADLMRMLSVTSLLAVAAGIRFDMLSGSEVIPVHEVPLVLNSMRFDTPVTVSLGASSVMPAGVVVDALGTVTFAALDDGADAVALVRTKTVEAASPNALRGMFDAVTDVQDVPPFRVNSIALVTPVIESDEPLYVAFGAAARAGTVTERVVADTNVVSVALTRT